MPTSRLFAFLIVLVILSGCGGPRAITGLESVSARGEPAAIVPIFVSTSRERSDNLALPYSAERSQKLNFAKFDIGIPQHHVPGSVEKSGRMPDPERHFTARSYRQIDGRKQFIAQLNEALALRAPEHREIFIFVHGYNNNFADSIFRNAQITHDYNVKSVALHYAWPSGGALPLYVFDRDSALVGRDGLAETIEIAAQTNARRIVLVGHSMGSYVVMEALRDLAISGRGRHLKRLGGVVLAAPDIDMDVFESQANDIGELPQPFMIVVSRRDRALGISTRVAGGHPRVGSGSDIAFLQSKGITVLDVSDLDGGRHGVFASSPTLMDLVNNGQLLRTTIRDEQTAVSPTILADGGAVIEGAASLVIFLPSRIIGRLAIVGAVR
ncbi:alpha/beta fold hydrolase [Rhizobiaceae bacterium n13]|uniref:Alpha/beta fold hydrolase n=1 Tax=Ferirhizobium litorale TaxID=2927786 RepID=A0AAE3QF60_9HYPH|nr:alpha/beta fold hydrolase [Fererhizobium litorale]MDI7861619.1 alpha/beta fold hydrolase [Fererhizobium litorale]MDI7922039.1 alpha/beta fold hydrolase [Fererhizobium litorale]